MTDQEKTELKQRLANLLAKTPKDGENGPLRLVIQVSTSPIGAYNVTVIYPSSDQRQPRGESFSGPLAELPSAL